MDGPCCITQRNEGTDGQSDPGIGSQCNSRLGSQEGEDTEGNGPSRHQQGSLIPPPASRVTGEMDGRRSPSPLPPSPSPPSPSPSTERKQRESSLPPPPEPLKRRLEQGDTGKGSDEEDSQDHDSPQKRQRLEQAKESEEASTDKPPQTTDGKAGGGGTKPEKLKRPPTKPKASQGKRRSTRSTKASVKKCRFLL